MFMGGVVVEDDVDGLFGGDLSVDHIQPSLFIQVGQNDWRATDFVVESMC